MAKSQLAEQLLSIIDGSHEMSTKEFMDAVNPIVVEVELDETMKTSRKLKIFDLFTRMSNCSEKERKKYGKKIARLL